MFRAGGWGPSTFWLQTAGDGCLAGNKKTGNFWPRLVLTPGAG